jgi:hypothetical protein
MFIIEPGESKEVQAASDPIGLKVAIVYDASPDGQVLFYQRWQCKNSSTLTVTFMDGGNISTFGGEFVSLKSGSILFKLWHFHNLDDTVSQGKGKVKEGNESSFALAIEALTYQAPITRAQIKK